MDNEESFDDERVGYNKKSVPGDSNSNISDLPLSMNNKSQEVKKNEKKNRNDISVELA